MKKMILSAVFVSMLAMVGCGGGQPAPVDPKAPTTTVAPVVNVTVPVATPTVLVVPVPVDASGAVVVPVVPVDASGGK